jgi:hypothetical protein
MARTVSEGFSDLLATLRASVAESEAAKAHRSSIKRCVEQNFGLNNFFRAGSFGNGTNVSGYSDVDYIASVPRASLKKDSGKSLTMLRDALAARFPSTGVRVNCPAVKVPFGTYRSETTEVVIADFVKAVDGHNIYEIPDCNGGWMSTSPTAHNAYVQKINKNLDSKVKPLIRLVKAWKFYNNVPISSFYLEMRVAKYAYGEESIVYWVDILGVLRHLQSIELAKMADPVGIAGYITSCSSRSDLDDALSKLRTAVARAQKALDAHMAEDTKGAFEWWDKLFNGKFPSYYR